MGGGYSNKFTGTAGSIGERREHQLSIFEKTPVRTKIDAVSIGGAGGGVIPVTRMKRCFCCGAQTIPSGTKYETCSICGWIDDPYQNKHPDSLNGKNPLTLDEARERYNNNNH